MLSAIDEVRCGVFSVYWRVRGGSNGCQRSDGCCEFGRRVVQRTNCLRSSTPKVAPPKQISKRAPSRCDGHVARAAGPALDLPHSAGPESSVPTCIRSRKRRCHLTEVRYGFEPGCFLSTVIPEVVGHSGNHGRASPG